MVWETANRMRKPESGGETPGVDPRSIAALRARTGAAHTAAERSGIISDLLNRRASRFGFALLLRNLLPVYDALERGLARHAATAPVDAIVRPELARRGALEQDLARIAGEGWRDLPIAPATLRYAERIEAVSGGAADRLIAHAYVRYFGDLSGGQILKRLFLETFDLRPDDLRFYEFDRIEDIARFKQDYRESIDQAMRVVAEPEPVLEEAVLAFEFNIAMSNEVRTLAAQPAFRD